MLQAERTDSKHAVHIVQRGTTEATLHFLGATMSDWASGAFIAPDRFDPDYLRTVTHGLEPPATLFRQLRSVQYRLSIEVDGADGQPVTCASVRRVSIERLGHARRSAAWTFPGDRWNDYLATIVALGLKHAHDAACGLPEAVRGFLSPSERRRLGCLGHDQFNYRTRGRGKLDALFVDEHALERAHVVRHRAGTAPLFWLCGGVSVVCHDRGGTPSELWNWPTLETDRRPLGSAEFQCEAVRACLHSLWGPGPDDAAFMAIERFMEPGVVVENLGVWGSVHRGRAELAALVKVVRESFRIEFFEIREVLPISSNTVLVTWNEVLHHTGGALGIQPTWRRVVGSGYSRVLFQDEFMKSGGEGPASGESLLFQLGLSADEISRVHPIYRLGSSRG